MYPEFFNEIKTIKLQDDLANFLGSFEDGIVEFSYVDVVKSAGHSCPTVAGAYLLAREGLKALYGEELPKRGEIKVYFKENLADGVAGVISNVFTQITGATDVSGFKGLGGKFARHSLMFFEADINSNVKLTRTDTNKSVEVVYDPSSIGGNPLMQELMQKSISGIATKEEFKSFGKLWQERVKNILNNSDKVISVIHL
jgi:hypothetical protein